MNNRVFIWFDSWIKTRSEKRIPYYDFVQVETKIKDESLHWFHEGYGRMCLYRLWKVDDENFIAEKLDVYCSTTSPNWPLYLEQPERALSL